MSAIPASSVSLKTMADGTLRITFDVEPGQAQDAFRLFAAPGTQVAIAALKAGSFLEQAPEAQIPVSAPVARTHTGDCCYRTVLWCQEPAFWDWINQVDEGAAIKTAGDAKRWVCMTCAVDSRKELDTDNEANKAWHRLIREPYSGAIPGLSGIERGGMTLRLRIFQGLWYCQRTCQGFGTAGIGYTPALAYADWLGWNGIWA